MTPPHRQPDAQDAQREGDAAERMEFLTGLDSEVRCADCSGYHQPGEVHCGICCGHHKVGDLETCGRLHRIKIERLTEEARRWRATRRMTARKRGRYA